jgi:MoxR-like ATPase
VIDSERFARAATRFKAFFDELRTAFVEREDVLAQIALALLAKEHVLMTGPPGTAKSQIASAVFGRIVCEETGAPSLFARQITESTVQTDLIGPVDFKTLTETGRTTHFTDEGILGAAHAFLDEVFDGRDMLLRSTLNVLNERELKQGGAITRGQTECALLTSNRYVSEVLEDSRETLLAFVDRIAFVSFVPRSFADPESLATVLKRRVAGGGRPSLDALLTIQDLDVLQAAVAESWVAPELCDAVASLLARFDAEVELGPTRRPELRADALPLDPNGRAMRRALEVRGRLPADLRGTQPQARRAPHRPRDVAAAPGARRAQAGRRRAHPRARERSGRAQAARDPAHRTRALRGLPREGRAARAHTAA